MSYLKELKKQRRKQLISTAGKIINERRTKCNIEINQKFAFSYVKKFKNIKVEIERDEYIKYLKMVCNMLLKQNNSVFNIKEKSMVKEKMFYIQGETLLNDIRDNITAVF